MAADREQAQQAIHATLTTLKQYLAQEAPQKLSEADTKANFIEPIVSVLGWTGIGIIVREYYVKNSQEFIDYVMRDAGSLLLAIEAKALQVDLTDKWAAQLVQYCVVEGIEWAALTNGRELRFFNTYLKGDLAAKLVLRLDLLAFNSDAEFDALFDQLWLLSRESMTTPAGVRTWLEQRRMDQALRAVLLNPASPIIKALQEQLADRDVKAVGEDIVAWFRAQLPVNVIPLPIITAPRKGATGREVPTSGPPSSVESKGLKRMGLSKGHAEATCYILPASKWGDDDAITHLRSWLDRGMWGMGESTPGRKHLKQGDRVCFYAATFGVAVVAAIAGPATTLLSRNEIPGGVQDHPIYRVPLQDIAWLPTPIVIDEAVRAALEAYKGKSTSAWGWLIQTTRAVSARDFDILTGRRVPDNMAGTA